MLFVLKAFISLLIIVNPLDALAGFFALSADRPVEERRAIARTAALAMTVILLVAVWLGQLLLVLFGISLGAFQVGGGLVVLLMAIAMLYARSSALTQTSAETDEAAGRDSIAIVPLAIPIMAGPGAISVAIHHAYHAGGIGGRIVLSGVVLLVGYVIWWILRKGETIQAFFGLTGINILRRVAGLILAAVGVQIIANGLVDLFPGLMGSGSVGHLD